MGTEITLDIGGMSIAYAKNDRGPDHGFLFQGKDRQRRRSEQIDYEAVDPDDPDLPLMEMGFARPLRDVWPRLELLGYTMVAVEAEYARVAASCREERQRLHEDGISDTCDDVMEFAEFRAFVTGVAIADLDDTFVSGGDDEEQRRMGRFSDETVKSRLPYYSKHGALSWSERSYFHSLIDVLHPYSTLRLLAENDRNLETLLEWQYGMLVANGWAKETEFVGNARRRQTFLIATEGSSDVHILERAFAMLRPEISDFFRFIDVSERHPFSGAGNLVRFAEGLVKIDVHNQVLFVLDNDAEGVSAFRKIEALALPDNMRALTLPALPAFASFSTTGPNGAGTADINGRAAAIECYLDLDREGLSSPVVRWTSYNRELDVYQGELVRKEEYGRWFHEQRNRADDYDTTKLSAILDAIYVICTDIAAKANADRERDES